MNDTTEALAKFTATVDVERVPSAVREAASTAMLDTIGVIVGAAGLEEARPLAGYVEEAAGRPEATAIGLQARVPARAAAYYNAWLADLLDFEDTFKYGGNHPSATVIPAALAAAERRGAPGSDVLAAVIAGYEVANRIARPFFPAQEERGFLSTGTAGAIGAAAAAGRVLGLDVGALAQALGIAGFLLPISAADTLWEGQSAKPAHAAQAAATGVEAALLAQAGFTAAPLEGGRTRRHGYLHMTVPDVDLGRITEGLGEEFTLPLCTVKVYPCCGYTHGAIDAALELHQELGREVRSAEAIVVRTYDRVVQAIGGRYTTRASSFTECQFSLPYVVAAALLDGAVGPAQFTAARRADPAIHRLGQQIRAVADAEMSAQVPRRFPYAVEVTIRGQVHAAAVDYPRGTPQRPLAPEEVRAKFDGLARPMLGADRADELAAKLQALERQPDVGWFGEAVAPRAASSAATASP